MRIGRRIAAMVVAAALVAPATALARGGAWDLDAQTRAASSPVEGGGAWVADLIARLGALLTSMWGAARGDIVPGAEAPAPTTTSTQAGGW